MRLSVNRAVHSWSSCDQLRSAAAVIRNKHCFRRCCGGKDISFIFKHISSVPSPLVVSLNLYMNPQWGGQRCKESTQVRKMSMQFGWTGMHPRDTQTVGLLGQEKRELLLLQPPFKYGIGLIAWWEAPERREEEQRKSKHWRVTTIPTSFPSSCLCFARDGEDRDSRLSSSTLVY